MLRVWNEIERLVEVNALHRKGYRLQECTPEFLLEHAAEELAELKAEPDDMIELADIFGCLIHFAIRQGWGLQDIETALRAKLKIRIIEPTVGESTVAALARLTEQIETGQPLKVTKVRRLNTPDGPMHTFDKRMIGCYTLHDNGDATGTIHIRVEAHAGWLEIIPAGYGECDANDGEGAPVKLDLYEGRLRAVINRDINSEDCEIIDLEGARESLRTPGEVTTIPTTFVKHVTVDDPDSGRPVMLEIRKLAGGGMVGIDGSWLEQDMGTVYSPYDKLPLDIPDDEEKGTAG